ncbi:MAG: DUF4245 domain-containing protein [Rothia sp. (in: high G+C Gram-positive bacteria)]|nr:DUF4245 domain-containing protein [Rothia sp. (in: high G+C Gram-positive bacteria)]
MTSSNSSDSALPASEQEGAQLADQQVLPQITRKQAERINAPARNMVISMLVMIALLLPVIWLMPQPNKNPYRPTVDLPPIAYEASAQAGYPVAAAQQEGWHYNYARWVTGQADGINYWSTGQVTPSNHFIELIQAQGTNPTWVAQFLGQAQPEAQVRLGEVDWQVRSLIDPDDQQKVTTFYVGQVQGSTIILKGQADGTEFQALAQASQDYMNSPSLTASPSPAGGIQ